MVLFLYPAGRLSTAAAWHKLVQTLGIGESFRTDLRIYSLSSLPRHIPGSVWFVTSRTLLYQERDVLNAVTIAATVAETGLLVLTGFIIAISSLVFGLDSLSGFPAIRIVSPLAVFFLIPLVASTPKLNKFLYTFLSRKNIEKIPRLDWGWFGALYSESGYCSRSVVAFTGADWNVGHSWGRKFVNSYRNSRVGCTRSDLGRIIKHDIPSTGRDCIDSSFSSCTDFGEFLWVAILVWATRKPSLRGTVN